MMDGGWFRQTEPQNEKRGSKEKRDNQLLQGVIHAAVGYTLPGKNLLFVTKGFDRDKAGGSISRVQAKEEAHRSGEDSCQ